MISMLGSMCFGFSICILILGGGASIIHGEWGIPIGFNWGVFIVFCYMSLTFFLMGLFLIIVGYLETKNNMEEG